MQDKFFSALGFFAKPMVEIYFLPTRQRFGFTFRQRSPHGKICGR